jgi:hypothetical protein
VLLDIVTIAGECDSQLKQAIVAYEVAAPSSSAAQPIIFGYLIVEYVSLKTERYDRRTIREPEQLSVSAKMIAALNLGP